MTAPRRRWLLILALAIVVVLAVTLALRLYSAARLERALSRFEQATGGLRFAELAPSRVEPRHQNAAFWLRSGADLLVYGDPPGLLERRLAEVGSPWSEADQQAFVDLLAANEPARSLMDRGASLDRSSFEVEYRRGADAEIPNFLPFVHAARLLGAECDFRQQRDELEAALATLHLLERLAAVQRREPMLISLLTGVATERIYLDRLEAILADARDVDTLRALAHDLDHLDAATVAASERLLRRRRRQLSGDVARGRRLARGVPRAARPEGPSLAASVAVVDRARSTERRDLRRDRTTRCRECRPASGRADSRTVRTRRPPPRSSSVPGGNDGARHRAKLSTRVSSASSGRARPAPWDGSRSSSRSRAPGTASTRESSSAFRSPPRPARPPPVNAWRTERSRLRFREPKQAGRKRRGGSASRRA